jgi:hypothetical protein
MSSKKKRRRVEYLKREAKRNAKRESEERFREAMESDDIEKIAAAYGIKLN